MKSFFAKIREITLSKVHNAKEELNSVEKIDVDDDWFEVIKLPKDVLAISEPGHWQHVISFLILGSIKSVLFDTGMGISDIAKVVRKLTDTDVMVVNSHTHFDHIGNDWRFPEINVYADNQAVDILKKGHTHDMVLFDSEPDKFFKEYPPGFDPEKYMIQPVDEDKIRLLHNRDIIDLGNRKLEVVHTPGHTNDSIMLIDRENRALFTGDTFYPDLLFAFFRDKWGNSDLQIYEATMKDLAKLVPDLDYLYPCHTEALVDPAILIDVAKAFEAVNKGEIEYKLDNLYFNTVRIYEFDGFSIGALNE
jgi:glyoxylase-like metal-dependent hydrolase (beta-lactamase superfamily II)